MQVTNPENERTNADARNVKCNGCNEKDWRKVNSFNLHCDDGTKSNFELCETCYVNLGNYFKQVFDKMNKSE